MFLSNAWLFLEDQVFKYSWPVFKYEVQYLVFKQYLNTDIGHGIW